MPCDIIINCYSTVFQTGNTHCYISGTELGAGSQRTQGLFHLLLLHHIFYPPRIRLLTPALPIGNAVGLVSTAGFGFQPPLIIWCGPSDLSINGNPIGVNTSQGLSEEHLNFDQAPLLIRRVLKLDLKFFTLLYRASMPKRERKSIKKASFSQKSGHIRRAVPMPGPPLLRVVDVTLHSGWGGEGVGRREIAEEPSE